MVAGVQQALERRALDLLWQVAEQRLDGRALVEDAAPAVDDRDQVARVGDERAEARLASAPQLLRGGGRAVEGEGDLRRERRERLLSVLPQGLSGCDRQQPEAAPAAGEGQADALGAAVELQRGGHVGRRRRAGEQRRFETRHRDLAAVRRGDYLGSVV